VFIGETLLSPEKQKKLMNDLIEKYLGKKLHVQRMNASNNHDIVRLTGHTNPNVIEDWMEKYKNINKFSRKNYSINDIASSFNYIKENPKDALPLVSKYWRIRLGNELINLDENRVKNLTKNKKNIIKK
jgi:hypothetical protein